jgi:hypothetical protein
VTAALGLALPAALAGCFGGSSSPSPEDILHETFSNPNHITSGNIDVSLDVQAQGQQGGNLQAKLSGPFQGNAGDTTQFPQFDLSASATGQVAGKDIHFQAGATATSDSAFVQYQNQEYAVPKQLFDSFKQSYTQQAQQAQASGSSSGSPFGQLGIDPASWVTNLSQEDDQDVGGVTTYHLHGDIDVGKLLSDIGAIAQSVPGASTQGIDPQQLQAAAAFVQNATIDVYSGKDDHILRKLDLALTITPPGGLGGVSSATVHLTIQLTGVNESQTISAPQNAKPLSGLLKQLGVGLNPSQLGGSGFSLPGLSGSVPGTSGSTSGSANGVQFQQCVAQAAGNADKINACAQKYL